MVSLLTQIHKSVILDSSTNKAMALTSSRKMFKLSAGAANGEFFLDVKNPKLFKKVRRFYENNGVVFSGDPMDDYDMLMEYAYNDLETAEVKS